MALSAPTEILLARLSSPAKGLRTRLLSFPLARIRVRIIPPRSSAERACASSLTERPRSGDSHRALSAVSVVGGGVPLAIDHGELFDLGSAPPVVAWTNNRNCLNCPHIEKIAIDADQ